MLCDLHEVHLFIQSPASLIAVDVLQLQLTDAPAPGRFLHGPEHGCADAQPPEFPVQGDGDGGAVAAFLLREELQAFTMTITVILLIRGMSREPR